MRVLWFTGVQFAALTGQGLRRAGWQEGLRQALEAYQPQVELGIATFGAQPREPLVQGNSTYYLIPRKTPPGRLARIWRAWQHPLYTREEYESCLELAQRFKPDLIHFHGTENFFGLISERLAVPAVLSIQAVINRLHPVLLTDLGWRDLLGQLLSREFLKGEGLIHRWLTLGKYRRVERKIFRACRNYIGRTAWDQAQVMAFNPEARYFHCDETLADVYYDQEWKMGAAQTDVVYSTGSDAAFKGSLTLAKAVAILKGRGRTKVKLHLAGVDAVSLVGRSIVRLVREQGLNGDILLLGRLDPQQIAQEMSRAGVFVLPTHMDNSPNSLCEAMLAGMPCIATRVGGIPSLVEDEANGLLYDDRDAPMLADKIVRILSDPGLAAQLGRQARQTALQRHDRRRIAERTVQIYQQVLSHPA